MLTLQRILEERQLEYAGLRKQYALVEGAIRGTSYVEEIQERISKAATEQDYEKSVSEDLELVRQLDTAKGAAAADRTERDLLKKENAGLKLDLGRVNQALHKAVGAEKQAAGHPGDVGGQVQQAGAPKESGSDPQAAGRDQNSQKKAALPADNEELRTWMTQIE